MPLLYYDDDKKKYFVIVADCVNFKKIDVRWWNDPNRVNVHQVDLDIAESEHEFDTFEESMKFMADWWINNHKSLVGC